MDIEKLKSHLGKAREYKIGKDTFYFKPLTVEYLPEMFSIINKLSINTEAPLSNLDKESVSTLTNLVRVMIKKSYPNMERDYIEKLTKEGVSEEEAKKEAQNTIDEFIFANFFPLVTALFEVNDLGAPKLETSKMSSLKAHMEQLKKAKEAKNA